jgi:hypothetical protein
MQGSDAKTVVPSSLECLTCPFSGRIIPLPNVFHPEESNVG